jgi:hypothetical protein
MQREQRTGSTSHCHAAMHILDAATIVLWMLSLSLGLAAMHVQAWISTSGLAFIIVHPCTIDQFASSARRVAAALCLVYVTLPRNAVVSSH